MSRTQGWAAWHPPTETSSRPIASVYPAIVVLSIGISSTRTTSRQRRAVHPAANPPRLSMAAAPPRSRAARRSAATNRSSESLVSMSRIRGSLWTRGGVSTSPLWREQLNGPGISGDAPTGVLTSRAWGTVIDTPERVVAATASDPQAAEV
jgi:hypothetical protein